MSARKTTSAGLSDDELRALTKPIPNLEVHERCPHAIVKIIPRSRCTLCLGIDAKRTNGPVLTRRKRRRDPEASARARRGQATKDAKRSRSAPILADITTVDPEILDENAE